MKNSWLRETSRDLLALGSIPFYFLVVARSIIGNYPVFVYQTLIAAIAIFILWFLIKDASMHVARALVIVVFTSLFYNEVVYTAFASLVWIAMLMAAYFLKRSMSFVLRGIIMGFLASIVGYYAQLLR